MATAVVTVNDSDLNSFGQPIRSLTVTSPDATEDNPVTLRDLLDASVYSDSVSRLRYADGVFYSISDRYFDDRAVGFLNRIDSENIGNISEASAVDYTTFNRTRRFLNSIGANGDYEHGAVGNFGTNGDPGTFTGYDSDSENFTGRSYVTFYDSEFIVFRNVKPQITPTIAGRMRSYYGGRVLNFDSATANTNHMFRIDRIHEVDFEHTADTSDDNYSDRGVRVWGSWIDSDYSPASPPSHSDWLLDSDGTAYSDGASLENGRSHPIDLISINGEQSAYDDQTGALQDLRGQQNEWQQQEWIFNTHVDFSGNIFDLNGGSNTYGTNVRINDFDGGRHTATPSAVVRDAVVFTNASTIQSGREEKPGFYKPGVLMNTAQLQRGGNRFVTAPILHDSDGATPKIIANRIIDLEMRSEAVQQNESGTYGNRLTIPNVSTDSIYKINFNLGSPIQISNNSNTDVVQEIEIPTPSPDFYQFRFGASPAEDKLNIRTTFPDNYYFYSDGSQQDITLQLTNIPFDSGNGPNFAFGGDLSSNLDLNLTFDNPGNYEPFQTTIESGAISTGDYLLIQGRQDWRFDLIHPQGAGVNFDKVRYQVLSDRLVFNNGDGETYDSGLTTSIVRTEDGVGDLVEETNIRTFNVDNRRFMRGFINGDLGNDDEAYDSDILLTATALGFHRDTYRHSIVLETDIPNRDASNRALIERSFTSIEGFNRSVDSDSEVKNLDQLYDRLVTYCFETDRDIREYVTANVETGVLTFRGTVTNTIDGTDYTQGRSLELFVDTGNVLNGSPYISPPSNVGQNNGFDIDSDAYNDGNGYTNFNNFLSGNLPTDTIVFPVADSEIGPGDLFTAFEFTAGFGLNQSTDANLVANRSFVAQVDTIDTRQGVLNVTFDNEVSSIQGNVRVSFFDSDVKLIDTFTDVSASQQPLSVHTGTGRGYNIGDNITLIITSDKHFEYIRTLVPATTITNHAVRLQIDANSNNPDAVASIRADISGIDFNIDSDVLDSEGGVWSDNLERGFIPEYDRPNAGSDSDLKGVYFRNIINTTDSEYINTEGKLLIIQYRDQGAGIDVPDAGQSNFLINQAKRTLAYQRVHLRNRQNNLIQSLVSENIYDNSLVINLSNDGDDTSIYLRSPLPSSPEHATQGIRFRQKGTPRQLTIDTVSTFGGAEITEMIVGETGTGNFGVTFLEQDAGAALTIEESARNVIRDSLRERFHNMNDSEFRRVMIAVANLNPTEIRRIQPDPEG